MMASILVIVWCYNETVASRLPVFDKRNAVDAEWLRLKPTEGEALPTPPPPPAATDGAVEAGRWL